MEEAVDGDFQKYVVETGAYIRKHFFGTDPRLEQLVQHMSDEELHKLRRGGHDPEKVFAAFQAAKEHKGGPTVILAKTTSTTSSGKLSTMSAGGTVRIRTTGVPPGGL